MVLYSFCVYNIANIAFDRHHDSGHRHSTRWGRGAEAFSLIFREASTFQDWDTLIEQSVTLIEQSYIVQSQAADFKKFPVETCPQTPQTEHASHAKYVQTVTISSLRKSPGGGLVNLREYKWSTLTRWVKTQVNSGSSELPLNSNHCIHIVVPGLAVNSAYDNEYMQQSIFAAWKVCV